jgi:hypothetical protein
MISKVATLRKYCKRYDDCLLCRWVFDLHIRMRIHPIPRCWILRNQFRPRNQSHPIPGTRSSFNITYLLVTDRVPSNSWNSMQFRNWKQFPEFRNCMEFRAILELEVIPGIPCNSGIGSDSRSSEIGWNSRNSVQFCAIPSPPNSGIPCRNYLSPSPSRIVLWSKISLWDK